MDCHYLAWVFKRTVVPTLIYVIACLVIWLLLGGRDGWIALAISVSAWVIFFLVHSKDPRTDQSYYKEHRDRFL